MFTRVLCEGIHEDLKFIDWLSCHNAGSSLLSLLLNYYTYLIKIYQLNFHINIDCIDNTIQQPVFHIINITVK